MAIQIINFLVLVYIFWRAFAKKIGKVLEDRKKMALSEMEIVENEKAKLGNVTPNSAYQQIANALLNNRAIEERNKLINKISEEYKIEEVAKEYTEAE